MAEHIQEFILNWQEMNTKIYSNNGFKLKIGMQQAPVRAQEGIGLGLYTTS